jgi:RNA polymerase sigma-70 factor (ECF subfamily)
MVFVDLEKTETEPAPEETLPWWQAISPELAQEEIKRLPDGCRQVFVLYVLENLEHQDIAKSLGVSIGTSKSQYHRAKRLLKERITQKIANDERSEDIF